MAVLAGKGTVSQSQGVGPKTYIYAITTGTITVSDACDSITTTYFGTVAAVEGVADVSKEQYKFKMENLYGSRWI